MRLFITLSLLLSLVACGGSNVAGKYTLDTTAMRAEVKKMMEAESAKMTADQKKQMEAAMGTTLDAMLKAMKGELQLAADGTFEGNIEMGMGNSSHIKGTYKVDGDKITMTGKGDGKDDKEETKTGKISGGEISLTEENDGKSMTMVFKKS